jgi:hypothetical protein
VTEVDVQDRRWLDHAWESGGPITDPAQVTITVGQ